MTLKRPLAVCRAAFRAHNRFGDKKLPSPGLTIMTQSPDLGESEHVFRKAEHSKRCKIDTSGRLTALLQGGAQSASTISQGSSQVANPANTPDLQGTVSDRRSRTG